MKLAGGVDARGVAVEATLQRVPLPLGNDRRERVDPNRLQQLPRQPEVLRAQNALVGRVKHILAARHVRHLEDVLHLPPVRVRLLLQRAEAG
jgi:hypothetical protein